jgi:hypothetical protein
MKIYSTSISIFLLILLFSACKKNEETTDVITPKHSATIRVTVTEFYQDNGIIKDSLVAGAVVSIYENKEDRDLNLTADFIKSTGIDGKAEFTNLEKEYYYLRVKHAITQLVIDDEVCTPDKTISLVDISF